MPADPSDTLRLLRTLAFAADLDEGERLRRIQTLFLAPPGDVNDLLAQGHKFTCILSALPRYAAYNDLERAGYHVSIPRHSMGITPDFRPFRLFLVGHGTHVPEFYGFRFERVYCLGLPHPRVIAQARSRQLDPTLAEEHL